jgi:2-keto-4-pentenoate hydratase/2-oxohepta-3-ene-1,7-dioic acid hydratase in catechol pathway
MGPWVVSADEIADPQHLRVTMRVNGEIKQDASTAAMIFPIAEIIASLSAGMTLEPGDVIATGTPEGVGFARTPPEFLKNGDVMEVEIERIGLLRNSVALTE